MLKVQTQQEMQASLDKWVVSTKGKKKQRGAVAQSNPVRKQSKLRKPNQIIKRRQK